LVVVAGIFVGGKGSRMGGIAKGQLRAAATTDETILERTTRILHAASVSACVLVGQPPRSEKDDPCLPPLLDDDPRATGPLAGVLALLEHAHALQADRVISIACDMPFITEDLVQRLLLSSSTAPLLAPRDAEDRWQPFFARWDPKRALAIATSFANEGGRKLQLLFSRARADVFALNKEEAKALADWDSPEDLPPNHPDGKTNAS